MIRGRAGVALIASALALPLIVGCTSPTLEPVASPAPSASVAPTPEASPDAGETAVPEIGTRDASIEALAASDTIVPTRLTMPDLDIDMTVEAHGLDAEGAMGLPEDAATAGWYRFGPGANADEGATVIAAHIDSRHDGIGPFSRLPNAAEGSVVTLSGDDGTQTDYVVTEVRTVGKIDAPMAEVFDRSGSPRLTLVTCGGAFDSATGHYVDNVIVTAVPVADSPSE
ncbi:class F sortase [Marisediminicola sp. LYQ85]|uniref:class F sortase n=1 Tax=Marisediminicola sp. LYQ85 TaxID=3391062 RepID=UPI003982E03C